MYSLRHHPTLGPWSLRSAAPVPPLLPQLRPRLQKPLPAPITTRATHTMSTCPRASLHHHPTTPQKTRRLSRPCPPSASYLKTPSWASREAASRIPGGQRGPCSSPGLSIKLAGASPDRKVELLASERHVPASHPSSAQRCPTQLPFRHLWSSQEHRVTPRSHDRSPQLKQRDSLATPPLLSRPFSLVTIVLHLLGS